MFSNKIQRIEFWILTNLTSSCLSFTHDWALLLRKADILFNQSTIVSNLTRIIDTISMRIDTKCQRFSSWFEYFCGETIFIHAEVSIVLFDKFLSKRFSFLTGTNCHFRFSDRGDLVEWIWSRYEVCHARVWLDSVYCGNFVWRMRRYSSCRTSSSVDQPFRLAQ